MKSIILIVLLGILPNLLFSYTEPIFVAEQTIKIGIGKEKELHYGFAEGDEIIFDLQVVKGKNVKEVEIVEYPYSSKFFEYKVKKISEKRLIALKSSVYKFRIKGGGISPKVCRIRIMRIPASTETANFDTSVKWKVRHDSIYVDKKVKELINVDTVSIELANRVERVHSQTNLSSSNISKFNFSLPQNETNELENSVLVSWAYWISTGNEGKSAYEKEKKKFLLENASKVGSMVNPIAGLAMGLFAITSNPPEGDNVKYWISTYHNGVPYTIAQGNSIVAVGRIDKTNQGTFTITLQNDNLRNGINADIKVVGIQIKQKFQYRYYKELQVKRFKYPVLSTVK